MKRYLLFFLVAMLWAANKTTTFNQREPDPNKYTLNNINNMHSWVKWSGQTGHNPFTGNSGGTYPAGTSTVVYVDGIIWVGWVRDGEELPLRSGGIYYYVGIVPGRILANGEAQSYDHPEVRVYRIRHDWQTMSDDELRKEASMLYNIALEEVTEELITQVWDQYKQDWLEWPVELGAPFYDLNGNNTYEPELGEEPGLAGADQVIWLVANDLNPAAVSKLSGCPPMGLELQMTLWGYKGNAAPHGQTIFQRYRLINKSGAVIDSMYLGKYTDLDIGDYSNDLVGVDTVLNLAFSYNGYPSDESFSKFGLAPPAIGFMHLQGPLVEETGRSGQFNFEQRINKKNLNPLAFHTPPPPCAICDPPLGVYEQTLQFYNQLRGNRAHNDIFNPTPQVYQSGPDSGQATKFPLSGDPISGTGDVDGQGGNMSPGDRRFFYSSGPFTMQPGDSQEVIYALVGGIDAAGDHLTSLSRLKENAAVVKNLFEHGLNIPRIEWESETVDEKNTALKIELDLNQFSEVQSAILNFSPEQGHEASFSLILNDNGQNGDQLAGDGIWSIRQNLLNRKYPFKADLVLITASETHTFSNMGSDLRLRPEPLISNWQVVWEDGRQDNSLNFGEKARLSFNLQNKDAHNSIGSVKLTSTQMKRIQQEMVYNQVIDPGSSIRDPGLYVPVQAPTEGDSARFTISLLYDGHVQTLVQAFPLLPWIPDSISGETIDVEAIIGYSYLVRPIIADPEALTGHTYRIDILKDEEPGQRVWQLYDQTENTIKLDSAAVIQPNEGNYYVVDGIRWELIDESRGVKGIVQISNSSGPLPESDWDYLGWQYQGNWVWHNASAPSNQNWFSLSRARVPNYNEDLILVQKEDSIGNSIPVDYLNHDFEFRFDGPQTGIFAHWLNGDSFEPIPFSVWAVGPSTYDDPSDDIRMLTGGFLPDTMQSFADFSYKDPYWGYPASGWLYARFPLDSLGSYEHFYEDVTSGIYSYDWWDHSQGFLSEIIFCDHSGGKTLPEEGTVIRIITKKQLIEGNSFVVQAPQAQPDLLYDYPQKYKLFQNYPNPFNTSTRIHFEISQPGNLSITIYDVLGRRVRQLLDQHYNKGWFWVLWDGQNDQGTPLSSGVYFYVLQGKNKVISKKMVLVK